MGRRAECQRELAGLEVHRWPAYLTERSGLPGPRADIELAQAVADTGDAALFDRLIADGDEYLVFCGVIGLGRLLAETPDAPKLEPRLRAHAADERWRVREAVAMALQRLGDADPARLCELVAEWARADDPLVLRAAVAAICEPRLLKTPGAVTTALDVCATATTWLAGLPAVRRRDDDVRTLRKALGYGWSVAVAADPAAGLPRFRTLAEADADVAWIVRENGKKTRLAKLLPPS
ncbi:HEAT repeat domain-containing protein [Paractinoplanes durhamensis]|uniref:HEAT repeat domain-containing protein n=1 Tax=Paractinoplanes durhamensis TaxID=113563 RepID=A0ABQ3Z2A6_9ACTN|nr:HEAT repeat domain-containing protein [Actinoplanes durhamensis]GIE03965.1 hypothetical protein Adu01nite_53150 [Actinoplanes durhamensis]